MKSMRLGSLTSARKASRALRTIGLSISIIWIFPHSLAGQEVAELDASVAKSLAISDIMPIFWLQYLELGEEREARKSLIAHLGNSIVTLDILLRSDELSYEEKEKFLSMLMMLVVMQEEYNIGAWRDDESIYSILVRARKNHPDLYKRQKCLDWSVPAGLGMRDCEDVQTSR